MVIVDYEALSLAYEFVSSAGPSEHEASFSLDTGEIYWVSDDNPTDQEIPDDIETSDRYVPVPHKHELDLGQLMLRFADEKMPHLYATIEACFRQRGAYGRFKQLLASEGMLEQWYAFESDATERALSDWCLENGIQVRKASGQ